MKFLWSEGGTTHRCYSQQIVTIMAKEWGGNTRPYRTKDIGYVLLRDGRFMAMIYGTINPDALGDWFDNIDDAKRYVEQQALIGIAINKLTR